jgi:exodeoxyribonuclease X
VLLRVIDIETTGLAPPAEIIEFGRVDVVSEGDAWKIGRPMARIYRPLNAIPPETMAVHHITVNDFTEDTPVCSEDRLKLAVFGGTAPDVLVAHNCSFECMFIPDTVTHDLSWICTMKVALRIWPDAPGHSNQILRYWRDLKLDAALAMPPHRAGPDAWVTAHLLVELLKATSVEQMIAWTKEPKLLPKVPFGKHRNSSWPDVPMDYLHWMARQADMDPDVVWCAQQELHRRTTKPVQGAPSSE